MKKSYDVIIVGAGPAGLKCAEQLMNSNLSVLIVEKNRIIGPKVCGGALTGQVDISNVPEHKTRIFYQQNTILVDDNYEINFITPLRTIDRYDLSQYQLGKIKNSKNITIKKGVIVKSIEENKIITNKGFFKFKYLVGADGSTSIIRKHIGLTSKLCVGITYNLPEITDEFVWYFNPKLIGSGYIWMFPHKRYTSIGIYFDPKQLGSKDAKLYLKKFLEDRNYKFSDNNFKGGSVNYLYGGCVFDNIFLIGDAAGLTSKIWGEGIPHALISGEEIGKKILNPDYKLIKLSESIKIKKRQDRISLIFDIFPVFQTCFIKLFIKLMEGTWFQYYFGIAISESFIKQDEKYFRSQKKISFSQTTSKIDWVRIR